jgi:uncharacterized integral membrane protein
MARTRKRDEPGTPYKSTGIWPQVVAGLVLGTAIVVFVAQNTRRIALHFLWLDFRTSPAVLVLATGLLSVAGSVIVGAAVRIRRRRILREREELERLRHEAAPQPDVAADHEASPRPPQ